HEQRIGSRQGVGESLRLRPADLRVEGVEGRRAALLRGGEDGEDSHALILSSVPSSSSSTVRSTGSFDIASGFGSMKQAMTPPRAASGATHRNSGTSASLYAPTTRSYTGPGRCATRSGVMLFADPRSPAPPGTALSPSSRLAMSREVKSVPTSDMPRVPPTWRK